MIDTLIGRFIYAMIGVTTLALGLRVIVAVSMVAHEWAVSIASYF